jgi:hypothetical protein
VDVLTVPEPVCPACGRLAETLLPTPRETVQPEEWGRVKLILGFGIASLAVSAMSMLLCCLPLLCFPVCLSGIGLGIPAIIMGLGDRRKIKAGILRPPRVRGTTGGWICGMMGTVLGAAVLILMLFQMLA